MASAERTGNGGISKLHFRHIFRGRQPLVQTLLNQHGQDLPDVAQRLFLGAALGEATGHRGTFRDNRRLYERLQVIRLWLMDMPVKQIALTLCRSDKTVRAYIHAYQDRGFDGLIMKRAPGKACRLTQLSILVVPEKKSTFLVRKAEVLFESKVGIGDPSACHLPRGTCTPNANVNTIACRPHSRHDRATAFRPSQRALHPYRKNVS